MTRRFRRRPRSDRGHESFEVTAARWLEMSTMSRMASLGMSTPRPAATPGPKR